MYKHKYNYEYKYEYKYICIHMYMNMHVRIKTCVCVCFSSWLAAESDVCNGKGAAVAARRLMRRGLMAWMSCCSIKTSKTCFQFSNTYTRMRRN